MVVYVDKEFKCHTSNPDGTFREIETVYFDGKCPVYVEGYCCDDSDGNRAFFPWKDHNELEKAQRDYERQLLAEYESALAEIEAALGV